MIDVFALSLLIGLESEVVDDERIDRGEREHLRVARVVESTLLERAKHLVSTDKTHVVAVSARDVTERLVTSRSADLAGCYST